LFVTKEIEAKIQKEKLQISEIIQQDRDNGGVVNSLFDKPLPAPAASADPAQPAAAASAASVPSAPQPAPAAKPAGNARNGRVLYRSGSKRKAKR
jgi:hypothetical protein